VLGDLTTALRPELQLDPLTLIEPGLEAAATDTVQMIRERTERMSQALRRRPLGVVDVHAEAPATAAVRTVRNTATDRLVTFHFFEPLERFRGAVRTPRARPVIFVPFPLPNVATPDVVRRFGYIFRRTLLDRGLLPDLERLLNSDDGWPRSGSRLLEHIEGNLLYYSTAIISAGDPAARHMALAKLRDPAGRPLTDVVENMVLGRVGNAIALPLRSAAQVPTEWRDALDAYAKRPPGRGAPAASPGHHHVRRRLPLQPGCRAPPVAAARLPGHDLPRGGARRRDQRVGPGRNPGAPARRRRGPRDAGAGDRVRLALGDARAADSARPGRGAAGVAGLARAPWRAARPPRPAAGGPVRRAQRPVAPRGSGGRLRGCGGNPPPDERRWHRSLRAAADPRHLGDLPGALRLGPVPATLALWNVRGRGNRT